VTIESEFLDNSASLLLESLGRIETCVDKLAPEQTWARSSGNQNAVGNLLLHLSGNVRQWILHGVGGQPDLRDRDAEFAALEGTGAKELLAGLRGTVEEAAALLRALPAERLLDRIFPQGYDVTVMGAIYHVVEHFSGHAFQIILLTKQFTGGDLGFYAHLSGARRLKDPIP